MTGKTKCTLKSNKNEEFTLRQIMLTFLNNSTFIFLIVETALGRRKEEHIEIRFQLCRSL